MAQKKTSPAKKKKPTVPPKKKSLTAKLVAKSGKRRVKSGAKPKIAAKAKAKKPLKPSPKVQGVGKKSASKGIKKKPIAAKPRSTAKSGKSAKAIGARPKGGAVKKTVAAKTKSPPSKVAIKALPTKGAQKSSATKPALKQAGARPGIQPQAKRTISPISRRLGPAAFRPSVTAKPAPVKKPIIPRKVLGKPGPAVVLPADYEPSDQEEFMNPRQQEFFRQKLLKWREDVLKESDETLMVLREESLQESDMNDRASLETDRSIELRTRDRQRKLLSKIDDALRRIDEGIYGYCEETGEPIGLKRLIARPIATLSLEAQERHERMERTHRDD